LTAVASSTIVAAFLLRKQSETLVESRVEGGAGGEHLRPSCGAWEVVMAPKIVVGGGARIVLDHVPFTLEDGALVRAEPDAQ
jgi:hypothetical protein